MNEKNHLAEDICFAEALAARGDVAAEGLALRILSRSDDPEMLCRGRRVLLRCTLLKGNREAALAHARALFEAPGVLPEDAIVAGNVFMAEANPAEARRCYDWVLAKDPSDTRALFNKANAELADGNADFAEAIYERLGETFPDDPDLMHMRALAQRERGCVEEAEGLLASLLEHAPHHIGAAWTRALLLTELGRLEAAAGQLDRLVRLAPGDPDILVERARLSLLRGASRDALADADRVLALDPARADADALRRKALMDAGEFNEALAAMPSDSEARIATDADCLFDRAECLDALGRTDEAAAVRRRARSMRRQPETSKTERSPLGLPSHAAAMAIHGQIHQSRLRVAPMHARFCFELAAVHEYFGDHAHAMEAYRVGNRTIRAELQFDADAYARVVSESAKAAGSPCDRTLDGDEGPRPVFIVGMPGSGTTLVEAAIASHPDVLAGGETPVLPRLVAELRHFLGLKPHHGASLEGMAPSLAAKAAEVYRSRWCKVVRPERAHGHVITDKLPENFRYIPAIRAIFPDALIVHVRRDPLDTCWSNYTSLYAGHNQPFAYDLEELGKVYRAYTDCMAYHRSHVAAERLVEVDYESFVADPDGETARLLDACGLSYVQSPLSVGTIQSSRIGRSRPYLPWLGRLLRMLGLETADFSSMAR